MDRRHGRAAGQHEPQRLAEDRHGAGSAHDRAGAGRGGEIAFDLADLVVVQRAGAVLRPEAPAVGRSEEHTSELQSLMRSSYAVFCWKKKMSYQFTRRQTVSRLPSIQHYSISWYTYTLST